MLKHFPLCVGASFIMRHFPRWKRFSVSKHFLKRRLCFKSEQFPWFVPKGFSCGCFQEFLPVRPLISLLLFSAGNFFYSVAKREYVWQREAYVEIRSEY